MRTPTVLFVALPMLLLRPTSGVKAQGELNGILSAFKKYPAVEKFVHERSLCYNVLNTSCRVVDRDIEVGGDVVGFAVQLHDKQRRRNSSEIRLWDLKACHEIQRISDDSLRTSHYQQILWGLSPDGTRVGAVTRKGDDTKVKVWHVQSGELLHVFERDEFGRDFSSVDSLDFVDRRTLIAHLRMSRWPT